MLELIIFTKKIIAEATYKYTTSVVPNSTFTFYTYCRLKQILIYTTMKSQFFMHLKFSKTHYNLLEVHMSMREKPNIFVHDKPMLHKSHKQHQPWPFLLDKCAVIRIYHDQEKHLSFRNCKIVMLLTFVDVGRNNKKPYFSVYAHIYHIPSRSYMVILQLIQYFL